MKARHSPEVTPQRQASYRPSPVVSEAAAIIVMGIAGSGKTTIGSLLAARLGWAFLDADTLHTPANTAKMSGGTPLDDLDRAAWLDAIAAWIEERRQVHEPAVIACSALKRAYRDRIMGTLARTRLVYLQ